VFAVSVPVVKAIGWQHALPAQYVVKYYCIGQGVVAESIRSFEVPVSQRQRTRWSAGIASGSPRFSCSTSPSRYAQVPPPGIPLHLVTSWAAVRSKASVRRQTHGHADSPCSLRACSQSLPNAVSSTSLACVK